MLNVLSEFWNMIGSSAFQQRFPGIPVNKMQERFANHLRNLGEAEDKKITQKTYRCFFYNQLKLLAAQNTLSTQEEKILKTVVDDLTLGSSALIALINTEASDENTSAFEASNAIISILQHSLARDSAAPKFFPNYMRAGTTKAEVLRPLPEGWTLLLLKVLKGDKKAVELLLQQGGSQVHQGLPNGTTALMIAAEKGYTDIVEILLKRGANIYQFNHDGLTALEIAQIHGQAGVVEKLLCNGARVNEPMPSNANRPKGWTLLMDAAQKGNLHVVEVLLQHGANVDQTTPDGAAALFVAASFGRAEIVEVLLQKNANINLATTIENRTPLIDACENGHLGVVEILLHRRSKLKINHPRTDGVTALMKAADNVKADNENRDIVEKLLAAGADPNQIAPGNGLTAFVIAVIHGNVEIVELMLQKGANVNRPSYLDIKWSPLQLAVKHGHLKVVELLVKHKDIKINQANREGLTPLIIAATSGRVDIVEILLKNSADVHQATSPSGQVTPLSVAKKCSNPKVIEKLLEYGADANTLKSNGITPSKVIVKQQADFQDDSPTEKCNSTSLPSLIHDFKTQVETFNNKANAIVKDTFLHEPNPSRLYNINPPGLYNYTRTELGRELYVFTKNFLDAHHHELTPAEKGEVFQEYISAWEANACELSPEHTEYAAAYKESKFGKYYSSYNERWPMTAGFNLSGARLELRKHNLFFLHVNLKGADFSKLTSCNSHFENCNMDNLITAEHTNLHPKNTNLNGSTFLRCSMKSINFQIPGLGQANVKNCTIINTSFNDTVCPRNCKDKPDILYPFFLKHLHIPMKKLNAEKVAHALWLSSKNTKETQNSKTQFSKWAENRGLPFAMEEVEECLSQKYIMK